MVAPARSSYSITGTGTGPVPGGGAPKRRALRVLGVLGSVVGLGATFTAAAAAGALLHLNTAPARRAIATQVTAALASLFQGRLELESVGHVDLGGARGIRARVRDPEGRTVLFADGMAARIETLALVRSLLLGKGELRVDLTDVEVDFAEVVLDTDAEGNLHLARAFAPRDTTPATGPSRDTRVALPHVLLHHAWAHGAPAGAPPLDVDVDDLRSAVLVAPAATTLDVLSGRIASRGMPRGADPRGGVTAHVEIPSAPGAGARALPFVATGSFGGDVGGVPLTAHGGMTGDRLDAVVDVPAVDGDKLKTLAPEVALRKPAALHAEAHGPLAALETRLHASVGNGPSGGSVDVTGTVAATRPLQANLRTEVRRIDLQDVLPQGPASDLNLDAKADVTVGEHGPSGPFRVEVRPSRVAGNVVPAAELDGTLQGSVVRARGTIHEAGVPTTLAVLVDTAARPGPQVEFDVHGQVPSLASIPRLAALTALPPRSVGGRADVRLTGRANLGAQTVDASARAEIADFSTSGLTLAHGVVEATVRGPFTNATSDVRVQGAGLEAGGERFDLAELRVLGTVPRPRVQARLVGSRLTGSPDLVASAAVELGPTTVVRDFRASVSRGDVKVEAAVAEARIAGPRVEVKGAVVDGLGQPLSLDGAVSPGSVRVRAKGDEVDLARVAKLARLEGGLLGGQVAVDADLALTRREAEGTLKVNLRHGRFRGVPLTGGVLEARLHGKSMLVGLESTLGDVGHLTLNTTAITVRGEPQRLETWKEATGRVQVEGEVDLEALRVFLPPGTLPLSEAKGHVTLEADLHRKGPFDAPDVEVQMETRGLVVAGAAPDIEATPRLATSGSGKTFGTVTGNAVGGTVVQGVAPWRVEGIDARASAQVEAISGNAAVLFRAYDAKGDLLQGEVRAALPYRDLWLDPTHAGPRLEKVPVDAVVAIPARKLGEMPPLLALRGMEGTVALRAEAKGTVDAPAFRMGAQLRDFRAHQSPLLTALDADVEGLYDGHRADLALRIREAGGGQWKQTRDFLSARATFNADAAALLETPKGQDPPWNGSVKVRVDGFPLRTVAVLSDRKVRGSLSGDIDLTGLHQDARLRVDLATQGLRMGKVAFQGTTLKASYDGSQLVGSAHLQQEGGLLDARTTATMTWGSALVPSVPPGGVVDATVEARSFRLGALQPLVEGTLSELDGQINGKAHAVLVPGGPATLEGSLALSDGVVHIPVLGQEFHDVQARAALDPTGIIRVEDASARGPTGRVTAAASVRLQGLAVSGARAAIRIPKDDPLPLSFEGEQLGEASGAVDIDATMSPDKKETDVKVSVPVLQVRLPETDTNAIQELDPAERVRVGTFRGDKTFTLLPLAKPEEIRPPEATRLRIALHLGDDVELTRGAQVRIKVDGDPAVEITDQARMNGQVRLVAGTLDVQGKRFEIEKGAVTFNDDLTNPLVVVTAYWDGPDGTRVFADFMGPLKTGKVTLRSEPSRPKSEILSLILFGTAEGANAQATAGQRQNPNTKYIGTGVGFATEGVNQALRKATKWDIATRVDTSTRNPRPEVEVQISRDVSAQIAYVLGLPPPGQNPDRYLLTVDWRLQRNWSLETTVGNRGSTIFDLMWQYRY